MTNGLLEYMTQARDAMAGMPLTVIDDVVQLLKAAWLDGRQVFLMGNGGSAATASHFVNDLNKTALISRRTRFKAIALTDNVPLITAWANDSSYDDIFAEQMLNYVARGDIIIAISTSGNSPNIIKALRIGRIICATTIGLTGLSGGKLKDLVDHCISVPTDDVMQIEGIHSVVLHAVVARFRQLVADDKSRGWETQAQSNGPRPAIFMDRDGVINENKEDYVKSWEEFTFLPGVFEPLKKLADDGHALVIISNQSAIGRGMVTSGKVEEINDRMLEAIGAVGGRVDGVYYCPHRPDEECDCRKPRPGLILKAAQQLGLDLTRSIIIGDAVSDVEAAREAGCASIFVLTGRGSRELPKLLAKGFNDVPVVEDLAQAVELVPSLRAVN
jgi:histidinol-phosphate phosphatase family protein